MPAHRRGRHPPDRSDARSRRAGLPRRAGALEPAEIDVRGAFRRTSAARTLADCAREWSLEEAVIAMDAGLLVKRVTRHQLDDAVKRVRTWRGGRRADRALSLADGRAESALETRGRLRIIGAGLPTPELQVEIRAEGRLIAVVDAWFEEAVAVEFDGQVKYTDPWRGRSPERVLWEEKRREDELRALDIGVVRIADEDVRSRWPRTEAALRRQLDRPRPLERRFTATPRAKGSSARADDRLADATAAVWGGTGRCTAALGRLIGGHTPRLGYR